MPEMTTEALPLRLYSPAMAISGPWMVQGSVEVNTSWRNLFHGKLFLRVRWSGPTGLRELAAVGISYGGGFVNEFSRPLPELRARLQSMFSQLQVPFPKVFPVRIERALNLLTAAASELAGSGIAGHQAFDAEYVETIFDSWSMFKDEEDDDHDWEEEEEEIDREWPASKEYVEKLEKTEYLRGEAETTGCVICMDDYGDGEKVTRMECSHMFHWDCLSNWLKKSFKCPLCRFQVPRSI